MTAAQLIPIMEAAARLRCRVTVQPDGSVIMGPLEQPAPARMNLAVHALVNINLPAPKKLTLISLALMAQGRDRCQPRISTLAFTTGCCARTVTQSLNELEQLGHIQILRQSGKRNTYVLTIITGGVAE